MSRPNLTPWNRGRSVAAEREAAALRSVVHAPTTDLPQRDADFARLLTLLAGVLADAEKVAGRPHPRRRKAAA